MKIDCHKNWSKAIKLIEANLDRKSKNILIQSGHFALLFDKSGNLIPAIYEDVDDIRLKEFVLDSNYMSDFPLRTFNQAIELAANLKSFNVKFSFIVNDWQWIKKGLYSFDSPSSDFYQNNELPKSYSELLKEHFFTENDIIKVNHSVKNGIYYSENKLRKQGKKYNQCSPETCATEYFPFLSDSLIEFDTLISFIPMSCKTPVLFATVQFLKQYHQAIDIFHIFYNPVDKKLELYLLNNKEELAGQLEEIELDYFKMTLMSI